MQDHHTPDMIQTDAHPPAEKLEIKRLGARGDGIAEGAAGPVFVSYALPGEQVTATLKGERGTLVRIEAASPARAEPICTLFTRCGGCAVQHMDEPLYRDWKQGLVQAAFERSVRPGLLKPMIDAHGTGRRRVTFHARKEAGVMRVGFMAARTHDLIEVATCPVLVPGLQQSATQATVVAEALGGAAKPLDLQVTASTAGLDVDIRGHGPVSDALRMKLGALAETLDLARLSLHGDLIVERRAPVQPMGKSAVAAQPGGFLQATQAGEEAIAALVLVATGKAKRVADLFAGCGPFSLRLAEKAQVHAVESEASALVSLDRAARRTPGLKTITTEARDLFRRPLLEPELNLYDAVVLDPPRAGAEAQVRWLASSKVPVIAYVSCDLQTFVRDAATLVAGGYVLEEVTPVDQFRYSAHIELVGVFRRPRRR